MLVLTQKGKKENEFKKHISASPQLQHKKLNAKKLGFLLIELTTREIDSFQTNKRDRYCEFFAPRFYEKKIVKCFFFSKKMSTI